jgi:tryptophan synthase alpha chain
MGVENFAKAAKEVGVDGVLVVDYPPEECVEFAKVMKAHEIAPIFLLAPTSSEQRFREVAEIGAGYIYYVSLKGVTGAGHLDLDEVARRIPEIQKIVGMPVGVGFGIRDAESAKKLGAVADAVVIGSRIIEEIERSGAADAPANVRTFLRGIRAALDEK